MTKLIAFGHLVALWVVAHPRTTGWILGALFAAYAAFATWATKKWPAPSGLSLKRIAHFVFLDLPAAAMAKNAVSARGVVLPIPGTEVKIPVPLLSWSQILAGPPPEPAPAPPAAKVITLPPPIRSGEEDK